MAKNTKPIPMPVATEPDYPSLDEINQRRAERMVERQFNREPVYAGCPSCGGQQLYQTQPEIRPTAYEPTRPVVCPNCGYRGSIVQDGY